MNNYKQQYEILHARYEKRAYSVLKKAFRQIINKIPIDNLTKENAKYIIIANFDKKLLNKAYKELYLSIGLSHGKWIVRQIDLETKDIGLFSFSELFKEALFGWMNVNVAQRITIVANTFIQDITNIIIGSFDNEKTIQNIKTDIYKKVNSPDFYKWQALRIARTETTTVSNYSAWLTAKNSNIELTKEWVSVVDKRTRVLPEDDFDHLHMNGVSLELDELFNVTGDELMFPGDSNGLVGNIVNCRCTMSFIPKRGANGLVIRKEKIK